MIVITTPTGAIGHQVLNHVLKAEAPVRVVVRDPARLATDVRERVEVIQGSTDDVEVVNKAFAGAHVVFWIVPPDEDTDDL
ncbi:MAG: NmrA family NAD(P)-binding protein, partial [Ktedonobacteraceae bacterium]|nr:NmrA family NAD(P)-binding protein [Ktedonobacteraceae bacterium]